MPYEFLDDVATADIAFSASGETLTELFQSAADAVLASMVDPSTVKPARALTFTVDEPTIEKLLFSFLEEIIFLKDKEAMLFSDIKVKVDEAALEATATLRGDSIDLKTQELRNDVKAVTMHYYKIDKDERGWKTQVVLDI